MSSSSQSPAAHRPRDSKLVIAGARYARSSGNSRMLCLQVKEGLHVTVRGLLRDVEAIFQKLLNPLKTKQQG